MSIREFFFAAVLAVSAAALVYGAAAVYGPAGWIAGGLLAPVGAWLVLGGADE